MATNTPVFQLRKPAITDLVAVITDIGDNMDKIEAALVDLNGAHARFYNDAAQAIPDITITKLEFPDDAETHSGVVKGNASTGANNKFTIGSGLWFIEASVAYSSGTGYRSLFIGTTDGAATWSEQAETITAHNTNLSTSVMRRVSVSTEVSIFAYADGGGVNTEPSGQRLHVSFTRIRS